MKYSSTGKIVMTICNKWIKELIIQSADLAGILLELDHSCLNAEKTHLQQDYAIIGKTLRKE